MARTVLGLYRTRTAADEAVDKLNDAGYKAKDISIIMRNEDHHDRHIVEDGGGSVAENVVGAAASGATTGGVIGGIAGLLIGIGAITIPGIGALLIGGPIAAALGLTGAAATTVTGAVTGAVAGGLVGALVGLGLPEEEARDYEEEIREGAILLAVSPRDTDDEDNVRSIFEETGAQKIRTV